MPSILIQTLRFSIVVAICVACAWTLNNNEITKEFRSDIYWAIIASTPFHTIGIFFLATRLALYSGGLKFKSNLAATKTIVLCQGVEFILPWRLSELFRVGYFSYTSGRSLPNAAAAVTKERAGDLLILTMMILVSAIFFKTKVTFGSIIIFCLAFASVAFFLFSGHFGKYLGLILSKVPDNIMGRRITKFLDEFMSNLSEGRFFFGLGIGFVAWVTNWLGVWTYIDLSLTSVANAPEIGAMEAFFIMTLVVASGIVPLLPAGFGLFEAAAVFGLTYLGMELYEALVIAIGLHITFLINGIVGTSIILLFEKIPLRKLTKRQSG